MTKTKIAQLMQNIKDALGTCDAFSNAGDGGVFKFEIEESDIPLKDLQSMANNCGDLINELDYAKCVATDGEEQVSDFLEELKKRGFVPATK